jgi:general secretion pathway protein D
VEYRDTGVILTVTPRVSGDSIMLNVSQEVSSVVKTTTSGIDSPTIRQRKMESTLLLRDNGLVALGGLISTTKTGGDTGVPGLRKAPVIGFLFKSQDTETRRTELIVLLTARIMRSPDDSSQATSDLLDDMKEIQSRGLAKP